MLYFFVFVAFLVILIATVWWLRSCSNNVSLTVNPMVPQPLETLFDKIDTAPDKPVNFGYKMTWLAIKSLDSEVVSQALPLENLQPANWHTGFIAAYNGHLFVSPPVNGWVLVISCQLPELQGEADQAEWQSLMLRLSKKFKYIQYFSTHRVVEYHSWAQYTNGSETRAFAYLGERDEILVNRGNKTTGEASLGYDYFDSDSPDAEEESYWEREDLCYPDEEHVMEVAGKWSINPNKLEDLNLPQGVGWVGTLSRTPSP